MKAKSEGKYIHYFLGNNKWSDWQHPHLPIELPPNPEDIMWEVKDDARKLTFTAHWTSGSIPFPKDLPSMLAMNIGGGHWHCTLVEVVKGLEDNEG